MPPCTSKANQQPDPNRCQTRPGNATTRPGKTAQERLAVRRKPEVIAKEKKEQEERREVRKQKKADMKTAASDVANFENRMASQDKNEEAMFPRRRPKGK
jgi:hypothetical protein